LERPKPVIVSKPQNRPVISKPTPRGSSRGSVQQRDYDISPSKKSSIISQWTYTKKINNKFYPGYCTWYAAIISPEIFPYIDEKNQDRSFG
jgi:hypothetical protein